MPQHLGIDQDSGKLVLVLQDNHSGFIVSKVIMLKISLYTCLFSLHRDMHGYCGGDTDYKLSKLLNEIKNIDLWSNLQ